MGNEEKSNPKPSTGPPKVEPVSQPPAPIDEKSIPKDAKVLSWNVPEGGKVIYFCPFSGKKKVVALPDGYSLRVNSLIAGSDPQGRYPFMGKDVTIKGTTFNIADTPPEHWWHGLRFLLGLDRDEKVHIAATAAINARLADKSPDGKAPYSFFKKPNRIFQRHIIAQWVK